MKPTQDKGKVKTPHYQVGGSSLRWTYPHPQFMKIYKKDIRGNLKCEVKKSKIYTPQQEVKGWDFDKRYYDINTPSGLNQAGFLTFKQMVDDIRNNFLPHILKADRKAIREKLLKLRDERPNKLFKEADIIPATAYELGRKDGTNTTIEDILNSL